MEETRSKTTEMAEEEVAVMAVVTLVMECLSPTSAKELESMRVVPVKVMALVLVPLTVVDEWEIAESAGELAVSR